MPNWCDNTLTITGDTTTLVELKSIIDSDDTGLLEAIKPIGDWVYQTAVDAWGCKWDVSSEGLEYTDNGDGTSTITGWFQSAWSPPIDAFQTLADDWDSCYIELKYFEPGMDFIGVWDSEGGDAYFDGVADMIHDGTFAEDDVLKELIEDFGCEEWYDTGEQMYEDPNITTPEDGVDTQVAPVFEKGYPSYEAVNGIKQDD